MTEKTVIVGVDTGGTFTDFVVLDGGTVRIHKESSSPDNPAEAVVSGLHHLIGDVAADIVHGSTVATNALLERKGARTALITTAGFCSANTNARQRRLRTESSVPEKSRPMGARVSARRRRRRRVAPKSGRLRISRRVNT